MGNDTQRLQLALKAEAEREHRPDFDPGTIDGARGPKTKAAIRAWAQWANEQAHGIDISVFQPNNDWQELVRVGVSFVAIRASVSTGKDALFHKHWAAAKQAGILRAAYHFFAPWQDPIKQARLVVDQLGADRGELPIVLDDEAVAPKAKEGQPAPIPVTQSQLIQRTGECLTELERLTQRRPIFYTYAAFARQYGLGKFFNGYPLWEADYREGPPTAPSDWPYLFHQRLGDTGRQPGVYTEDGKNLQPCDLDRFRGSLEQLKAFAGR